MKKFDYVVVGAGPAGVMAATTAAKMGKSVALLEKCRVGGASVWNGCIPSKALLKASKLVRELGRLKRFDIEIDIKNIDTNKSMNHIQDVMSDAHSSYMRLLDKFSNISIFFGDFIFEDGHTLKCGEDSIFGEKIIICVGAKTFVPPIDGLKEIDFLTNQNIFDLKKLPSSLIVIGAGAIGIELASSLNRLGVFCSVVLRESRILSQDDEELALMLQNKLVEEGMRFIDFATPKRFIKSSSGVILEYEKDGKLERIEAENLLIATGRTPDVEKLNLEGIGVETQRKKVVSDNYLATKLPHIYVAGDCVGPFGFVHSAEYQAYIATKNAFGDRLECDYSSFGWCTFTDPELAGMGLRESEARDRFGENEIIVFKEEYRDIHRGFSDDKQRGVLKIISKSDGEILGATILGERAAELVNELIVAKSAKVKLQNIANMVHIYPSFSDIIINAARSCRDYLKS